MKDTRIQGPEVYLMYFGFGCSAAFSRSEPLEQIIILRNVQSAKCHKFLGQKDDRALWKWISQNECG